MVIRIIGCAALIALTCHGPASAQELPDSATIRERSAAASGPTPNNFREIVTFQTGDVAGKVLTLRRGSDFRSLSDNGHIHTEAGSYKGERWHQNDNGHTVIDLSDPGLANRESTTTSVKRVSQPLDAFEISTLTARGFGTRDYIDPTTYFVIRRDTLRSTGNAITLYDDFRAFGNRHLATHWHVEDASTGLKSDYHLAEYTTDVIQDTDVAIPPIRRALLEFPANTTHVRLPARLAPDGHWIVRVTIGDRGLDFLLDTGASGITMDTASAAQLGISPTNVFQNAVNAGRITSGKLIVPEMHVGELTLHDVVAQAVPDTIHVEDAKIVGLLGFDFLAEAQFTLDYERGNVTVDRFGSYSEPQLPRTAALDIRLSTQQPMISTTIDGAVAERIVLDTGATASLLIFDYFARRNPDVFPNNKQVRSTKMFSGIGGRFETTAYKLNDIVVGGIDFKDFTVYRVASNSYSSPSDGLMGSDFLRLFTLTLDYPNGKLYLSANALGRSAMGR